MWWGRILLCLFIMFMGTACSSLPGQQPKPVVVTTPVTPSVPVVVTPEPEDTPDRPPTVVPDNVEVVVVPVQGPAPPPPLVLDKPVTKPVPTKPAVATNKPKPTPTAPVVRPIPQPVVKPPTSVTDIPNLVPDAPPIVGAATPATNTASIVPPAKPAKPIPVNPTLDPIRVNTPTAMPYGRKPVTDWRAKVIPEGMKKFFSVIKDVVANMWVDFKFPSMILAQIEQETCISPTHSKCGSPRAELKTKREYGFGIGQTTIAYKADGTERFNVWKELRAKDPVLKQKWTWDNRFDAELQVRALMVKNRMGYSQVKFDTADEFQKIAFSFVTYNSGSPLIDRKLCEAAPDCDPRYWFNTAKRKGVESYSAKSRVVVKGYGASFYEISREYPIMLLYVRRQKYVPYVEQILQEEKQK